MDSFEILLERFTRAIESRNREEIVKINGEVDGILFKLLEAFV